MIEKRAERVAEQILGDESLTGEMNDQEAQVLLDWAVRAAHKIVEQTASMNDAEADEFLENVIPGLRRVVRRINKMIGNLSSYSPEDAIGKLEKIYEAAATLPGITTSLTTNIPMMGTLLTRQTPDDALRQILRHMDLEGSEKP